MSILTADQLAFEMQEARCRQALKEIDVPANVIYGLHGPLLFQLAHLCIMIDQPMQWRDALRWMNDHKGELMNHVQQLEKEKHEQASAAAKSADRAANGADVGSAREGQSLRVGDDGLSMGREEDSSRGSDRSP